MGREMEALRKNLNGIKKMSKLPDVLFVIDPFKEQIAVKEARTLGIPIVSVVDTNCDPDDVDWVIPGNDDAIRSIKLMCGAVTEACLEGKAGAGDGADMAALTGIPAGEAVPLSAAELESRFAVYPTGEAAPAEAQPQ